MAKRSKKKRGVSKKIPAIRKNNGGAWKMKGVALWQRSSAVLYTIADDGESAPRPSQNRNAMFASDAVIDLHQATENGRGGLYTIRSRSQRRTCRMI